MRRQNAESLLLLLASAVLFALFFAWGPRGMPVGAILLALGMGWLEVGGRGLPQVEVSAVGVTTGVVCIALTLLVLHRFAAWIYAEVRRKQVRGDWPPAWRWKWTMGLLAAVMLMFIAGLIGVGLFRTTSWLLETPEIVPRKTIS